MMDQSSSRAYGSVSSQQLREQHLCAIKIIAPAALRNGLQRAV
jgi:hypothetical protein